MLLSISIFICINSQCNALGLNCQFSTRHFELVGDLYSCEATLLTDYENVERVTVVYGLHQSGKGHGDVAGLYIHDQDMKYFPVNIESFFPNLKALVFPHNSILSVNQTHLQPFPNLEYLDLYTNNITMLGSNLLSGLQSMRRLSVASNNIQHVGHDFILPNNGFAYFESNPCINITALTPEAMETLRFDLLKNCPPTISQIEETLESRKNLLTNLDKRVQYLANEVSYVKYVNEYLERRIEFLERIIEGSITNSQMEGKFAALEGLVENLKTIVESALGENSENVTMGKAK